MLISQDEKDRPMGLVGGKGQGLLGLKSLEARLNTQGFDLKVEVPYFFIIPPDVGLDSATQEILQAAEKVGSVYAVRSSSALEDVGEHSFDGIFDSILNVRREELLAAIKQVRRSATAEKAQRYSAEVGVTLDGKMPVIVQKMIQEKTATGVAYSKFPCSYDITKVIIDEPDYHQMFSAFSRNPSTRRVLIFTNSPLVIPEEPAENTVVKGTRSYSYFNFHKTLAECAVFAENELGTPRILEFAFFVPFYTSHVKQQTIYLFQARKCTNFPKQVIHLRESDMRRQEFVAEGGANGVGEYTGIAYVVHKNWEDLAFDVDSAKLRLFDKEHPQGYVLVTPQLEFDSNDFVWTVSPNRKAVVAYSQIGTHHDLELTRKAGILYININQACSGFCDDLAIQTGDIVRVVSDGLLAFVFNLSRTIPH